MGELRVSIEIGDSQAANFETVETLVDEGTLFTIIPRSTLAGLGIGGGRSLSPTGESASSTWRARRFGWMARL